MNPSPKRARSAAARSRAPGEEGRGHLRCVVCRKIIEFDEPKLSTLVATVARDLGFVLTHQHHVLSGVCPGCRARHPASK